MDAKGIIFIGFEGSIFSILLKKHGIRVLSPYKYESRFFYKIRFLLNLMHFSTRLFADLNDDLYGLSPKMIIIEGSLIFEPFIKKIRKAYPNTIIKYLYPNIVADKASIHPDILRKYGCLAYSWDPMDCKVFSLIPLKSFYSKNVAYSSETFMYDLCFIGTDKGRYGLVKRIQEYAREHSLKFYMHVCPTFNFLRYTNKNYKSPLNYCDYLNIVSKSRCIIDFVQKGQSGTTMRTLEAIFSGKKLISNNDYLREMDFYNPNNIYILKDENFEGLINFLKSDYIPVNKNILETYTFEYWFNKLLNDEN